VVVDVTSVDESANDVSEVVEVVDVSEAVEVGDESVSGTAEEGSKAVDVGAACVVDRASVVDTAKDESVSVEEGLVAAIDGEMPATVEEYSDKDDKSSRREVERASVTGSREVVRSEDSASGSKVDEGCEDVVDSTVPLDRGVWRLCSRWCNSSARWTALRPGLWFLM
jgi:hypothetical protein